MIFQKIYNHSNKCPNKIALSCEKDTRDYRTLLTAALYYSNLIDNFCKNNKVKKHGYIGILLENSLDFIEVFLGAIHSEYVPTIYNSDWSKRQLESICSKTKPHLILAHESLIKKYDYCIKSKYPIIRPNFKKNAFYDFDRLTEKNTYKDILFVGFTSGSTNLPKGFVRSQTSWVKSFKASSKEFSINSNSVVVAPGPLAHGFTLYAVMEALIQGASVHVQKKFDLTRLLPILKNQYNTHLIAIPTMLKMMFSDIRYANKKFIKLGTIITSAEKLNKDTSHKIQTTFPNAKIIEYYGASELGFISIRHVNDPHCLSDSVGRPFKNVKINIVHEQNNVGTTNNIGEIWVKSPFIMNCYLTAKQNTNYQNKNGWATVGDLGYVDKNGYLYMLGRKDDMIITGGYNVYPSEVENAIKTLSYVENVYVFGIPNDKWGSMVCAALKIKTSSTASKEEIKTACSQLLVHYKIPKKIFVLSSVPVTASGKVSRKLIIEQVLENNSNIYELK